MRKDTHFKKDNLRSPAVIAEHFKSGSYALVNILMCIYFCLRKLIVRMICLILLIQCPNRPESYSQSFEKPEQTPLNQLSLYKFVDFRF